MAVSNIKATFSCDLKDVWEIVTSLDDYSWRSDLSKITRLNEKQFVEYTKDGFETHFTITCKEEFKRWEFDLENKNIKGHWKGIFSFHENVVAKKLLLKPFVGIYLKKQQATYIEDLKKALEKK